MSLTGGKRKVNKSLKAWVAFVKKVQKEEKLSYKDAIHRAKVRKDKGEKWMTGGSAADPVVEEEEVIMGPASSPPTPGPETETETETEIDINELREETGNPFYGGRRRRRTMRRSRGRGRGRGRGRTARRSRGRASRRH